MNLLASFWLRGECDHPHTGSLNLCVNVYVCIPIHSQYTEGSDHKSVLSMCFKARRLPLKGNVRVSSGTPVSEQGEENCWAHSHSSENWALAWACANSSAEAPGYLDNQRPRSTWGPKPYYIFDFLKCFLITERY